MRIYNTIETDEYIEAVCELSIKELNIALCDLDEEARKIDPPRNWLEYEGWLGNGHNLRMAMFGERNKMGRLKLRLDDSNDVMIDEMDGGTVVILDEESREKLRGIIARRYQ